MRILFVTPYPASRIRARSYCFIAQLAQWRSLATHGEAYIRAYHHLDVIVQQLLAVYTKALNK